MCEIVIAEESNIYYDSTSIADFTIKSNKLDITKLKILLTNLGFNPTLKGTIYIMEELQYLIDNNINEIGKLKDLFYISAKIHNISTEKVQWDVEKSIKSMNKYSNKELLRSVLYWYNDSQNIYPKYFMTSMFSYLKENFDRYKK